MCPGEGNTMTEHEHNEVPTATFVDAEDTKDYAPEHEQVVEADHAEQLSAENLGDNIVKAATEAAYAAVGFAGFVGEKARSFYEEQQRQYVASHPDTDSSEGAKAFLAQMREQVNKFVDELTKGYRDMAERGRGEARHADAEKPGEPEAPVEQPGPPAS